MGSRVPYLLLLVGLLGTLGWLPCAKADDPLPFLNIHMISHTYTSTYPPLEIIIIIVTHPFLWISSTPPKP